MRSKHEEAAPAQHSIDPTGASVEGAVLWDVDWRTITDTVRRWVRDVAH
jgi:hypothetical protein